MVRQLRRYCEGKFSARVFVLLLEAAASSPTYMVSPEFIYLSDSLHIYLHFKLLLDNIILSLFHLRNAFSGSIVEESNLAILPSKL